MSINIALNSTQSLQSYLADYQENFSFNKWGGFNSWWLFATSGTQYANGEGSVFNAGDVSKRGFVAEGQLNYQFNGHVLHGQLDSIKLGHGLQGVTPRNLASEEFNISGLNLSSNASEGRNGEVHKIIYGLMKPKKAIDGNKGVKHLEDKLNENDLNITGNNLDNQLQGYNGNDTLTGGAGNDTFTFKAYDNGTSFGNDTITDYQSGEVIKIYTNKTSQQIESASSLVNGNMVIDLGSQGTITVNGVTDVNDLTIQAVA